MPARFLLHTTLLFAAVVGVYIWLNSPLNAYTLQLVALLALLYLGVHRLKRRLPHLFRRNLISLDLTLLTCMALILISSTGHLDSPLFFLLYFLLFAIALLYEIEATLVLTASLLLYFVLTPFTDLTRLNHLSELLALIMVTPLAILTGHQYETSLEEKALRRRLTHQLSHQETDTLLFLSLNLKSTLTRALDSLSATIPITRVTLVKDNLQALYTDLRALYKTSLELERAIDKETDN